MAGWWLSCNEVQPDRGWCFGAGVQPGQLAAPRTVPSHHVCDTTSALWCSSGHAHTCTHAHTHWRAALLSDIDKSRSAPHFYRKNSLLELLVFSPGLNTCCLFLFPALVLSSFGVLPTLLLRRVWTKGLCDPRSAFPAQLLAAFANKACIPLGDSYPPAWLCGDETFPFHSPLETTTTKCTCCHV